MCMVKGRDELNWVSQLSYLRLKYTEVTLSREKHSVVELFVCLRLNKYIINIGFFFGKEYEPPLRSFPYDKWI